MQRVVAFLHRLGYTQAAHDAARVLPDLVSLKQFWKFAEQHHMEQILFDRLMFAASRYRRRTQQVTKEAWDKLHAEFTAGADWARNVSELTWVSGTLTVVYAGIQPEDPSAQLPSLSPYFWHVDE